jgi:hypothetical protein
MCGRCGAGLRSREDFKHACVTCLAGLCETCIRRYGEEFRLAVSCAACLHGGPPEPPKEDDELDLRFEFDLPETTKRIPWLHGTGREL